MRHNITSIKASEAATTDTPGDIGFIPGTGALEIRVADDGESEQVSASFRVGQSAVRPSLLTRDLLLTLKYMDEGTGSEISLDLGSEDVPVRLQVSETDTRDVSFTYSRKI